MIDEIKYQGPAILDGGFRLFFLGAAAWAPVALSCWLLTLSGQFSLASAFDPLSWHRHELIFGYCGAVLAGFLLTAVPNWTQRPAPRGLPVAGLFALWFAARLSNGYSQELVTALPILLDSGFLFALTAWATREVFSAGNRRNYLVVMLMVALTVACLFSHGSNLGWTRDDMGYRFGLSVVTGLMLLIGGRIVPAFTRNWLTANTDIHTETFKLPVNKPVLEHMVFVTCGLGLLSWTIAPGTTLSGGLLLLAGGLNLLRLSFWTGWRTFAEPLLSVMHFGYLLLAVALALMGLQILEGLPLQLSAVHLLTAGGVATMTLAVMSRATLGHSGRPLRADKITVLAFACVTLGALLRVVVPSLSAGDFFFWQTVSGCLWGGGFVLFLLRFGPSMFRSRE